MPAPKREPRTARTVINELIERVNGDTQRLRIVEQSSESLASRMDTLEQALLQQRRDIQKNLVEIADKIADLESATAKSDSVIKEIVSHMKKLVTESQLKELQTLIEIYNPVKSSFVTREELEKAIKRKDGRRQESPSIKE
jgi:flagellar motility protein MotE (MotC chaperone)